MSDDILLKSKLFRPVVKEEDLRRERLALASIDGGLNTHAFAVVAPAGYGKSTLLSQWYDEIEPGWRCCWVSLDQEDNNPIRLIRYIIAAVQEIEPDFGASAIAAISTGGQISIRGLLKEIVVGLEQIDVRVALFLDDYHLLVRDAATAVIGWLAIHSPPGFRMFVGSRSKPENLTNRLTLLEQIVMITEKELAFTPKEIKELARLYNRTGVTDKTILQLGKKTEGWAAAVKLALLAAEEESNFAQLVSNLTGQDRDIGDYLSETVLSSQEESVQRFLLKISLLQRVSSELCNYAFEIGNSQELLELIERKNLFLIPLDRDRKWFRLHHLFASHLESTMLATAADEARHILRRSSTWLEEHGEVVPAVECAIKSGDYAQASSQIAKVIEDLVLRRGEHHRIVEWVQSLPEEIMDSNQRIRFGYIWSLTFVRNHDEAQRQLELLEAHCNDATASAKNPSEVEYLRSAAGVCRCAILGHTDNVVQCVSEAKVWLAANSTASDLFKAIVNDALAYGALATNELSLCGEAARAAEKHSIASGSQYGKAWANAIYGMCQTKLGEIDKARLHYERALSESERLLGPASYTSSLLSIHCAEVYYE